MIVHHEIIKTYKVLPENKNSIFEIGCWSNTICNKEVILLITTIWRYGYFNIDIPESKRFLLAQQDLLIVNDYNGECIETTDGYEYNIEIKDLETYSHEEKQAIYENIYENIDEEIFYDETTLEDNGWLLDDTIYEIHGGIIIEHEDDSLFE